MPLQIRRGTNVERQAITPAPGELIFVTNTNQLFVGNGVTVGGILATGYTNNDAQDAAAVIFTANNSAHSNINFAYNTSLNLITAAVNLSDYAGVIKADAFKGSVFADDGSTVGGTELVNAVDGSLNLNGTVKDHVIPDASLAYDLGSAALRFRDLYLSGSSIELGAASITATGSAVNLPAGSTVGGVAIGGGSGGGIDDYSGNIIGDDSTIIVNTSNNSIVATGGITGPLFTDAVNAVTGTIFVESDFHIVGANAQTGSLVVQNTENAFIATAQFETFSSTGANGGFVSFSSSRGDLTNRVRLENGDIIYSLAFLSLGVGGADATAAFITAKVDGTTSNSIAPGALDFSVSNDIGIFNSALEIKSSALTVIKKGLSTDAGQDLANAGVVDLTTVSTFFTTSGPETATLAAGAEGQIKTFAAINVSAGDMTITVTNAAWAGAGTITFNQPAGCIIQYISSRWVCIGNNGVLFA